MSLSLESPAFRHGDAIPQRYARNGKNVSPPLSWTDPPAGTRSFALLVEDPDAPSGTFRHWAVYDIAPQRTTLQAATTKATEPGLGYAVNDFGSTGYDGPQPPRGHGRHHYHFRLAALDVAHLALPDNAPAAEVWRAARSHMLAEADLVGTFETR